MLSTTTYVVKQTQNVNYAAEVYGNLVGKMVKIMLPGGVMTILEKWVELEDNLRLYVVNNGEIAGPVLGLCMDDLEETT